MVPTDFRGGRKQDHSLARWREIVAEGYPAGILAGQQMQMMSCSTALPLKQMWATPLLFPSNRKCDTCGVVGGVFRLLQPAWAIILVLPAQVDQVHMLRERLAQAEAALADQKQQTLAMTACHESAQAQARAAEEERSKELAAARCAMLLRLLLHCGSPHRRADK